MPSLARITIPGIRRTVPLPQPYANVIVESCTYELVLKEGEAHTDAAEMVDAYRRLQRQEVDLMVSKWEQRPSPARTDAIAVHAAKQTATQADKDALATKFPDGAYLIWPGHAAKGPWQAGKGYAWQKLVPVQVEKWSDWAKEKGAFFAAELPEHVDFEPGSKATAKGGATAKQLAFIEKLEAQCAAKDLQYERPILKTPKDASAYIEGLQKRLGQA